MKCNICPRKCDRQRDKGEVGYCGVDGRIRVARAALHFWEEPCISGTEGSGTVFFSGCNLHCVYCQNQKISKGNVGKYISVDELAHIFLDLQKKGANNINLVTPTHYCKEIKEALILAKQNGLQIPIVYNCGGYESEESLRMLDGLIDIYLTDFKYMSHELSKKYSKASDYPEVAKKALKEMVRQQGVPIFEGMDENEDGIMKAGVIVRHLILPGYTSDSKKIVKYLYETYGNQIYISLMSQFTPLPHTKAYPELMRTVTEEEYDAVVDYAIDLGVECGFIQEGEVAKESFIPEFSDQLEEE